MLHNNVGSLTRVAIGDWQERLLVLFKDMKMKQFARTNKITVDEARKQLEAKGGKIATATHIVSAIHLRLNSYWRECR